MSEPMTLERIEHFRTFRFQVTKKPEEMIAADDPTGNLLTTGMILRGFDELAEFAEATLSNPPISQTQKADAFMDGYRAGDSGNAGLLSGILEVLKDVRENTKA